MATAPLILAQYKFANSKSSLSHASWLSFRHLANAALSSHARSRKIVKFFFLAFRTRDERGEEQGVEVGDKYVDEDELDVELSDDCDEEKREEYDPMELRGDELVFELSEDWDDKKCEEYESNARVDDVDMFL